MLEALVSHIFLPARVPGKSDEGLHGLTEAFAERLINASLLLRNSGAGELFPQYDRLRMVLQTARRLNSGAKLDKDGLLAAFQHLDDDKPLILFVTEQNAGLLIRKCDRNTSSSVIFETFEASTPSATVLASQNALVRKLPDRAVSIPFTEFSTTTFQKELSLFLEQASTESIKRFAAQTMKAGSAAFESRDTVDPAIVTELLMTLLEAIGKRIQPSTFQKRIRDEVYWEDGAEKPWRRSPMWLVLRVGLLSYLNQVFDYEVARAHYKFVQCIVLAQLIDDTFETLSPEIVAFQVAKLSRRAAKLQTERQQAPSEVREVYDILFRICEPSLRRTMRRANSYVSTTWETFKTGVQRRIGLLNRLADGRSLVLSLSNSRNYIQKALNNHIVIRNDVSRDGPFDRSQIVPSTSGGKFYEFASQHFKLFRIEEALTAKLVETPPPMTSPQQRCLELAKDIESFVDLMNGMSFDNPEQNSLMLLTLMGLWVAMDKIALSIFNLLSDYSTGFPPTLLDVLHIASFADMHRLRDVQNHLVNRHRRAKFPDLTILADPSEGCFAQQFYDQQDSEEELHTLHEEIVTASDTARRKKAEEWQRLSSEFENLQKRIAESTCLFRTEDYGIVHDDRCTKCYLQRKARRMHILVHEDFLPHDSVQAKAAVFELACPEPFTAYRNATWKLISTFALFKPAKGSDPVALLPEYPGLKSFHRAKSSRLILASNTKSWLSMHNRKVRFPTSLEGICLSNGLKLEYFDTVAGIWPGQISQRFSFANHCQCVLPSSSPLATLQFSPNFNVDHVGPTSYEIIAAQTKAPPGVNAHEFIAFQTLYSGRHRRWPQILLELASTNLNFSTEATCVLIAQVALQAGPAYGSDARRAVHRVFHDEAFCLALSTQLDRRLDAIEFSWREVICMESLITIILRLFYLSGVSFRDRAMGLLVKARMTTFKWVLQLQSSIQTATTAADARTCSNYAFWAALLCKRTLSNYIDALTLTTFSRTATTNEGSEGPSNSSEAGQRIAGHAQRSFSAEEFECYIVCSVVLHDNIPAEPSKLLSLLRNALVRDLRVVFSLRHVLRSTMRNHHGSFGSAIDRLWPHDTASQRTYSPPEILNDYWVQSKTAATAFGRSQSMQYHLLQGNLLIDGKPLGKLPSEYLDSVILKELFGEQNLLTYSSKLPGMNYTLAFIKEDHEVHIGTRGGALVVQASHRGRLLELVPREIFGQASRLDLPAPLIQDCVHWLDLESGVLEARRRPDIWKSKLGNWQIDFRNYTGRRRASSLVDPYSQVFRTITKVFDHFEDPMHIVVTQPDKGSAQIELRRLELSFFINGRRLLQCQELKAEVDLNQDAGTWYGLRSKIVLRDATNARQRSIIVPMGQLTYARRGCHVETFAAHKGVYARFSINSTLGRLECPTEPTLMYLKTQYHAYTSFVIPDPLTGRTGSEEALSSLESGYSQPWSPLGDQPLNILATIAALSPRRSYYPASLKVMQKVSWSPYLTVTIQHESFRPIVDNILHVSQQLSVFSALPSNTISLSPDGDWALRTRHISRSGLYVRENDASQLSLVTSRKDSIYVTGDHEDTPLRRGHVFEIVGMIRSRTGLFRSAPDLVSLLSRWPVIGGFDRQFDKILLTDRLDCDIALEWGPLVNLCRSYKEDEIYQILFLFAALAFRSSIAMSALHALIAFTCTENLRTIETPKMSSFTRFQYNHLPTDIYLAQSIDSCRVPYPGDERQFQGHRLDYSHRRKLEAAQRAHEQETQADCKTLAQHFILQWPHPDPTFDGLDRPLLLDMPQALELLRNEWSRLLRNIELSKYVQQVQAILNTRIGNPLIKMPMTELPPMEYFPIGSDQKFLPKLSQDLLSDDILIDNIKRQDIIKAIVTENPTQSVPSVMAPLRNKENISFASPNIAPEKRPFVQIRPDVEELEEILIKFTASRSNIRQRYGQDLMQSWIALRGSLSDNTDVPHVPVPLPAIREKVDGMKRRVTDSLNVISVACAQSDPREPWLTEGRLRPVITPVTLLEKLRSIACTRISPAVKTLLLAYALQITHLQKLLRMEDALLRGNSQLFRDEQLNPGHENWQPAQYPDWLLLEIESNILVRKDQVDVALATISPASGSNSVLQMNMGQGKTSCVIPMAVAILANSKNLMRVIVPKSLLLQTAQLMQARLGGLLGRMVRHVPFSRKTSTNPNTTESYFRLHQEILSAAGIMLVLPENLLSFKLSGLQRLSEKRLAEAKPMISTQGWLQSVSRDVLDESDFILAVRTQLIYPSGEQVAVDGHPYRWEIAEALLQLVQSHLRDLQQKYPRSLEIARRSTRGYPVVFLLRNDVENALLARLVDDIIYGRLPFLPTRQCSKAQRGAIKAFLSGPTIRSSVYEEMKQILPDQPKVQKALYLLRGLLVHRILILALKKRWNVQYGLHPHRDPIAVPFHAKGVPSEQSEFGHPDVAILFTCLAFYYSGLNLPQIKQSLENILRSDDPSSVYERWMHGAATLPESLKDWSVINVGDAFQLEEIWRHVRYQVVVIDYYMNNFVFPQHAKQFQTKLQASGWDISLIHAERQSTGFSAVGRINQQLTTGFSGTNDNRTMLPLTIEQQDLPALSHTNAEVLTYLLQRRNRRCIVMTDQFGRRQSELDLLQRLKHMGIRMLIDAGAQILEMDNLGLAKAWLKIDHEASAAVFFDEANRPWVLYRNMHRVPLLASPFAENLQNCLVYLDEAHTRGTDLKMPPRAEGALTLGLGQTKDHTVQAAMRLRKLGTTQSLVFFLPPEVHQSIMDICKKGVGDHFDSKDVLYWLLEQTCLGIEQLQPLYYSQGVDFCRRMHGAIENANFLANDGHREQYVKIIKQPEKQTLEQLYKPVGKPKTRSSAIVISPQVAIFMKELQARRKAFQDSGSAVQASALQEVEQEREVAYEVQAVRESQKPVHYSPLSFHGLHQDILKFLETGRLTAASKACDHFLVYLGRTTLGIKYGVHGNGTSSKLYLSREFSRTVLLPNSCPNSDFMRQVTWVLWSITTETALIINPEEAEIIWPRLFNAKDSPVHLILYTAPVTRKMTFFNKVNFYAIPAMPESWEAPVWLTIELLILSGGLYFEYELYMPIRNYLGFCTNEGEDGEQLDEDNIEGEHVGIPLTGKSSSATMSFTAKPLTFLQEWLAIRRKGQDFTHTPMGYVCQGRQLDPNHPFFVETDDIEKAKPDKAFKPEKQWREVARHDTGLLPNGNADAEHEDDEEDDVRDEAQLGDDDILDDEEIEWQYEEGVMYDEESPGESE